MEKRTILAVVLSSVIMIIWFFLNNRYFTPPTEQIGPGYENGTELTDSGILPKRSSLKVVEDTDVVSEDFDITTGVYRIRFSTLGGVVKSIKLPEFPESDGNPVEMNISRDTGKYPFGISFGNFDTANLVFNYSLSTDKKIVTFSRTFEADTSEGPVRFKMKKIFYFIEDEYAFNMSVVLESIDTDYIPLNFDNKMYTLFYGPQMGPYFEQLNRPNEYRNLIYFSNNKRVDFTSKVRKGNKAVDKIVNWGAIESKYFVVIASLPHSFSEPGTLVFSTAPLFNKDGSQVDETASMIFNRPLSSSSRIEDKFKFYIGPKRKSSLAAYNSYYFDRAIKDPALIGWLVVILKKILVFLKGLTGNWGIAIIILTILIKIVFFPLTQKGFKSNTKIQALTPKVNEIRERLKANPQKMNEELAALYKREQVNPLGGCLYLIIQMPIFFALYNLLNNHFELRGAVFIEGWMGDLSAPETFITLPFTIPILNWNELRILPFVMLGMTFLQQKLTATGNTQQNKQMKYMMYLMPLFFFFVLYQMPSGLVVYWTMQNILTVFQQLYINKTLKTEPVVQSAEPAKKSRPRSKK